MGRQQKQRKEAQKRQREWRRGGTHNATGAPGLSDSLTETDGRRIQRLSYQVSPERLDYVEPANQAFVHAIPEEERRQLFEDALEQPLSAIPQLKQLMEKYPGTPMLSNWLAAAYTKAGFLDEADRINELNYESNPDYLFARTAYAQVCLLRKQPEKAAEVMDHKFDLKLLYPHREVFHTTEFTAISSIAILYYLQAGKRDLAERLLDLMEQLAPDAESTRIMHQEVFASKLSLAARKVADLIRSGRRLSKSM
jgi:tetratricopeptide (TPR) repeat protein